LQLLSLQVITVNRRHCSARASRYGRAEARRAGVRLGATQARSGAGRAERGAIARRADALIPASLGAGPPPRGATAGGMI
jgi:hypothetical protein